MVISPKFLNMMTQLNISLSEKQLEQFDKYYQLLVEWNKVMNLTVLQSMMRCFVSILQTVYPSQKLMI